MTAPQLPLSLVPSRPAPASKVHIDRAEAIARQIPTITHKAGKRYAVHLLLTELIRALRG